MEPEKIVWITTFVNVMGIRLHPRNDPPNTPDAAAIARVAADIAVEKYREAWQWQSSQPARS